jgi:hypothetical protein
LKLIKAHDEEFTVSQWETKAAEELAWSSSTFYRRYGELKKGKDIYLQPISKFVCVKPT